MDLQKTFPTTAVVRTLAQHGESIRGIQEHCICGAHTVRANSLRFKEAVENGTRNMKLARFGIETAVAVVPESPPLGLENLRSSRVRDHVSSDNAHRYAASQIMYYLVLEICSIKKPCSLLVGKKQ
ncbi:hypothetical protein Tco_1251804 [Tanacetum coccineum]